MQQIAKSWGENLQMFKVTPFVNSQCPRSLKETCHNVAFDPILPSYMLNPKILQTDQPQPRMCIYIYTYIYLVQIVY